LGQDFDWCLESHVAKWVEQTSFDGLDFYGTFSLAEIANQAIQLGLADMELMDGISIPIALLVLYATLASGRLVMLTLISMSTCTILSCSVLWFMSLSTTIEVTTPPVVMCLVVAMSVDYSLFIGARFKEELLKVGACDKDGAALETAVQVAICTVMVTSGATICVSGLVLGASFGFLALFPAQIVASLGQGCVITTLFLVVINLTLTPALLSAFPRFFAHAASDECAGARFWRVIFGRRFSQGDVAGCCWTATARATTTKPWSIFILVVVISSTAVISHSTARMETTFALTQVLSEHTKLFSTVERAMRAFGGGASLPYQVLFRYNNGSSILSSEFFAASQACIQDVQKGLMERIPEAGGTGFYFLSALFDSYHHVNVSLDGNFGWRSLCFHQSNFLFSDICSFLKTMTNTDDYTNPNTPPTAMMGLVVPSVDPMGKLGPEVLAHLRELFDIHSAKNDLSVAIAGASVYAVDMMTSVYSFFSGMLVATLGSAMIFMGVSFRSVVMPLRAIVSNLLTVGFSFGLAVLVYQDGALDFLKWHALSGRFKAVPWVVPVVVFFVVTGLGLDYDIFLSVRITEFRAEGHSPTEAIRRGLIATGGIITSAGIIMSVAFGSLLFSSIIELNMLGLMMTSSVLFDTFVARSLVNPAMMSIIGRANWWPSSLSNIDIGAIEDGKRINLLSSSVP